MAVTDLTNTKWLFNEEVDAQTVSAFNITFTSNNNTYIKLSLTGVRMLYWENADTSTRVYDENEVVWLDDAYKTIEITGGTDVTSTDFISWLTANATQIEEPTQSNYLEIYSNDERATHYKIYANGVLVATLPRVNVTQEGSEITVLNAPATQSGIEVTLG